MQADIAAWAARVKELGLLQDRGGGNKDYVNTLGTDSSIFELRLGNVYYRVVWSEQNPSGAPFSYFCYISQKYPHFPKTEFHLDQYYVPTYLNGTQVERILFGGREKGG